MSGGGVYAAAGFLGVARVGVLAAGVFAAVFRAVVLAPDFGAVFLGVCFATFVTAFFAVFFMGRTLQARRNVVNGGMRLTTLDRLRALAVRISDRRR